MGAGKQWFIIASLAQVNWKRNKEYVIRKRPIQEGDHMQIAEKHANDIHGTLSCYA